MGKLLGHRYSTYSKCKYSVKPVGRSAKMKFLPLRAEGSARPRKAPSLIGPVRPNPAWGESEGVYFRNHKIR